MSLKTYINSHEIKKIKNRSRNIIVIKFPSYTIIIMLLWWKEKKNGNERQREPDKNNEKKNQKQDGMLKGKRERERDQGQRRRERKYGGWENSMFKGREEE